jgi:hypothetical protein
VAKSSTAKGTRDERAERLAEVRRQQRSSERRRTLMVFGGAGALVAALVAAVAVVVVREEAAQDPARVGVTASAASCGPVQTLPATGASEHIGPGTPTPDVTTVEYDTVPAVSGQHFASPVYPAAPFYTAEDRPPVEQLVHNLEHGYTLLWYSEDAPQEQLDQLAEVAEKARDLDATAGKVIAAPWDASRGALPDDATVALAHWGAEQSYLQTCGAVSGEAITSFLEAHPYTDSPEPNAA